MRIPHLVVIAGAAAACGGAGTGVRTDAPAAAPHAEIRDTTLTITGPTFIALFADVTQEQVDADPGITEALADFQYYVDRIAPRLAAAGIAAHEVYADSLRLVDGASPSPRRAFGADSTRYVYLAPGRAARTLESIATDVELLETASAYFGLPSLVTHPP